MKLTHILPLILMPAVLAACGASSTDPNLGDALSGESVTIDEVALTGSGPADASGVIPINSGVNGGAFQISWKVSTSDQTGYYVGAHLSDDANLETGVTGDPKILSYSCLKVRGCGSTASSSCRFTNSNTIECELGTSYPQIQNLNGFLDALPKTTNMIVQVCNSLFNRCKTETLVVQLQ